MPVALSTLVQAVALEQVTAIRTRRNARPGTRKGRERHEVDYPVHRVREEGRGAGPHRVRVARGPDLAGGRRGVDADGHERERHLPVDSAEARGGGLTTAAFPEGRTS